MDIWTYIIGAIEFSTLSKDKDFSKFYVEEVLKFVELTKMDSKDKVSFYANTKDDEWILTFSGNIRGDYIMDMQERVSKFLVYFYRYFAINNISISLYNDSGVIIDFNSLFLDTNEDIKLLDKLSNYDYNSERLKRQKEYLDRYKSKQWCNLRDKCLELSDADFISLIENVKCHKKEGK